MSLWLLIWSELYNPSVLWRVWKPKVQWCDFRDAASASFAKTPMITMSPSYAETQFTALPLSMTSMESSSLKLGSIRSSTRASWSGVCAWPSILCISVWQTNSNGPPGPLTRRSTMSSQSPTVMMAIMGCNFPWIRVELSMTLLDLVTISNWSLNDTNIREKNIHQLKSSWYRKKKKKRKTSQNKHFQSLSTSSSSHLAICHFYLSQWLPAPRSMSPMIQWLRRPDAAWTRDHGRCQRPRASLLESTWAWQVSWFSWSLAKILKAQWSTEEFLLRNWSLTWFSNLEVRKVVAKLRKTIENSSFFPWLKTKPRNWCMPNCSTTCKSSLGNSDASMPKSSICETPSATPRTSTWNHRETPGKFNWPNKNLEKQNRSLKNFDNFYVVTFHIMNSSGTLYKKMCILYNILL